jgi:hypothetical protein
MERSDRDLIREAEIENSMTATAMMRLGENRSEGEILIAHLQCQTIV